MRRLVSRLESVLFLMAALALGYCAYVLIESRLYREQAMHELEGLSRPNTERSTSKNVKPKEGAPVAEIVIPRLGISEVVLEGTQERTLQRSVGHVTGTAEPGKPGNICLAGHRDTFFRPLRQIAAGDSIQLNFPGGSKQYRVEKSWVVDPSDVEVLNPSGRDELTLITCYPFYFIGSAPRRFVVRARVVSDTEASGRRHAVASR